jgi:hypothetical protein
MDGDSDFQIEDADEAGGLPQTKARAVIVQQAAQPRQQPQQQRKRLRKSCEAAASAPPSAAAADATAAAAGDSDSDCDPAVQIARHRHRVLQDSDSDEELADAGGVYAAAVTAAAAAGGYCDEHVSKTRQPTAVRSRYQQAAAGAGHKPQPTAAVDLDCIITESTPAPARAPRGKIAGGNTQQTQQQSKAQQVKAMQQKPRKLSTGAGGVDAGQSKLDKFFSSSAVRPASTPAQQQAPAAAAAGAGDTSGSRTGPSPLNLSRVTSSTQRKSNSFASRMQAEGLQGGFKTPAAGLKGSKTSASLAGMAAGVGGALGGGWQGQRGGAGPSAAAAAATGVPAAPWWRPLTAAEGSMSPFDLVSRTSVRVQVQLMYVLERFCP